MAGVKFAPLSGYGISTCAAWRPRRKDSKLGRVPNPNHVWYWLRGVPPGIE